MDLPFISVVVPVRNRSGMIGACLDALLAQTYPRELTEIIVVENGSDDDTLAVVSRYPVTVLVERTIQTSYSARNRGIAHARGEVIAFTDSDCIAAPDWLEHLAQPFRDDSVGAAMGTIADAPPRSLVEEFAGRVRPFARSQVRGLTTLLTANAAIRKSVLQESGGFDEHLPTAGDVDLGWRIQRTLGLRIAEAPGAQVRHIHRSTLGAVFSQYKRYGLSEILLTTLYQGEAGSTTPGKQLGRMLRQVLASWTYVLSLALRVTTWPWRPNGRARALWPVFLLTVEVGNLTGKIVGLTKTRYYRRNPYPSLRRIRRDSCAGSEPLTAVVGSDRTRHSTA